MVGASRVVSGVSARAQASEKRHRWWRIWVGFAGGEHLAQQFLAASRGTDLAGRVVGGTRLPQPGELALDSLAPPVSSIVRCTYAGSMPRPRRLSCSRVARWWTSVTMSLARCTRYHSSPGDTGKGGNDTQSCRNLVLTKS